MSLKIDISTEMDGGTRNLQVQMEVQPGSFTAITGPSGAGKTTLLRILAGLQSAEKGRISWKGNLWQSENQFVKPQKRSVGLVFQDYALFPHLNVRKNVAFGAASGEDKWVQELIEMAGLAEFSNRKPAQLSGGQQQRVALARALAARPEVLLLDEPLAAVDAEMRDQLQDFLRKIVETTATTVLMVTHDLAQIFRLADFRLHISPDGTSWLASPETFLEDASVSHKLRLTAEIVSIKQADVLYVVTLIAGNNVLRIVADEEEIAGLKPGDKVLLADKAWNPSLIRLK